MDGAVFAVTIGIAAAATSAAIEQAPILPALAAALCLALFWMRDLAAVLPAGAAMLAVVALTPVAVSWMAGSILSVPITSGAWIASALLGAAVVAGRLGGWRQAAATALAAVPAFGILVIANVGGWIGVTGLTDSTLRIALPAAAGVTACLFVPLRQARFTSRPKIQDLRSALIAAAAGVLGALLTWPIPASPLRGIVFDEAHGRWETVQANFGPDDFGRSASYTYSLLANYARALVGAATYNADEGAPLPPVDQAFVLKMPTTTLSAGFRDRLARWVEEGGRLLVVADHTDLYDHAQHLNALLSERWGMRINTDAAYDREGRPNAPTTSTLLRAVGRMDATGVSTPWLTGSTASRIPPGSVVLAGFGPAFAEPGDYGRPNRFGPFLPRTTLPYASTAAAFAFPAGAGMVAVILDSTPWSNFSAFREEYRRLFRGLLGALAEPTAVTLLGWLPLALLMAAFGTAFVRRRSALVSLALLLGMVVGLGWRVSAAGVGSLADGRDYGLRTVVGSAGRLEFLPQLVGPGERNYARIISAMAKYGLDPISAAPGAPLASLQQARRWLLLEPDADSLPSAQDVFAHLRAGRDLTVVFPPHIAADQRVRDWLASLDLGLSTSTALSTSEDAGRAAIGSFAARRGATLMRDTRVVTMPRQDGLLKEHAFDRLWQTYTVRPTTLPRTSGLFTVGFGADQLSDAVVGDVWDGVRPSALGALRERQLGLLLRGDEPPSPWPETVLLAAPTVPPTQKFRGFLLVEDGRVLLDGSFHEAELTRTEAVPIAFDDAPRKWLVDLRARALALVEGHCPPRSVSEPTVNTHPCPVRLVSSDGVEWLVSRRDRNGALEAVELLHERRWSGVGANLNVVFAD